MQAEDAAMEIDGEDILKGADELTENKPTAKELQNKNPSV